MRIWLHGLINPQGGLGRLARLGRLFLDLLSPILSLLSSCPLDLLRPRRPLGTLSPGAIYPLRRLLLSRLRLLGLPLGPPLPLDPPLRLLLRGLLPRRLLLDLLSRLRLLGRLLLDLLSRLRLLPRRPLRRGLLLGPLLWLLLLRVLLRRLLPRRLLLDLPLRLRLPLGRLLPRRLRLLGLPLRPPLLLDLLLRLLLLRVLPRRLLPHRLLLDLPLRRLLLELLLGVVGSLRRRQGAIDNALELGRVGGGGRPECGHGCCGEDHLRAAAGWPPDRDGPGVLGGERKMHG